MAWIESHRRLGTHRKLLAMARSLKISRAQAIGMLHLFWWWALDAAPDGDITGVNPIDIGVVMDWNRSDNRSVSRSQSLYNCLVSCGWIEEKEGRTLIHDWNDYAGNLISKRKQNAERMRQVRSTHVQNTFVAHTGATVPNSTQHNSTITPTPSNNLPEWLNKETWGNFLLMRKTMKALPTTHATKLLLKRLDELRITGDDPNAILNQSIMNNWKGLFPLKEGGNAHGTNPKNPIALPDRRSYTRPEDYRGDGKQT